LPEKQALNFEAEARVLVDWLGKDKRFCRRDDSAEVNVQGRLFELIPKVTDSKLLAQMQEV